MNRIAKQALATEPDKSKSWFVNIHLLCEKYDLPSPLILLGTPLSKEALKKLFKRKVSDFWEKSLHDQCEDKLSLTFFKPEFYSLTKPHPILTSCGSNPFETNKSVVQCRLLSGRFRSDWLARHWSKENKDGHCALCGADRGDILHMLNSCSSLSDKRTELFT